MEEESILDFNFWPSFADIMLSLVLILILVIFSLAAVMSSAFDVSLQRVNNNQMSVIDNIAMTYNVLPRKIDAKHFGISITKSKTDDILITNEPTMQKITFSSQILFIPNSYDLNKQGMEALRRVGKVLKDNVSGFREIQIQGHADIAKTPYFPSNIHLAALRAITVYEFLQNEIKIDPIKNLMSVTSFGEFKPVQRSDDDLNYDETTLKKDNESEELRGKNRRIELRLFYRYLN